MANKPLAEYPCGCRTYVNDKGGTQVSRCGKTKEQGCRYGEKMG